jgi:hypothetical protein
MASPLHFVGAGEVSYGYQEQDPWFVKHLIKTYPRKQEVCAMPPNIKGL